MNDLDIESLSDELQEQDADNVKDILEELIKDVDPNDVVIDVDLAGRINVIICGTPVGTINRYAFEKDDGQMMTKATFQPVIMS